MDFTRQLLKVCLILLLQVSFVVLVQNNGPHLHSNANHDSQQTYLPPAAYVNPIYNTGIANSIDPQHLPQEQLPFPQYYPFPPPQRKHYKIVLVRPPPKPTPPPVPQPEIEEQTIVYVLVKKPDEPKIEIEQPEPAYKPSKPEVYFIKYQTKTTEDHHKPSEQSQTQVDSSQYLPPTSPSS